MGQLKPNQILNKAYRQVAIETEDFNRFKEALHTLLSTISDGQREETQKEHLRNFLSDTFYKPYYMAPEEDIDLAVRLDKTSKSNIGLLIEVKSITNKNEMISVGNLNRKALQELLLYYLRERISKKNSDIKYLIATNVYEYFIFDAQEFEQKFYQNKKLKKEFQDFEDGRKTSRKTDFFYSEIASSFIEEVADSLDYTYFDIRSYAKYLGENTASKKLIELYKVFSDVHLLKLPFQNDSNSLNKKFYAELLHILGIEEKKENNKIVIVRKAVGQRNEASLLENTINQLDAEDCLRKIPNIAIYGSTQEERLFNVAMELCITWINRILFLKLLEAQMLKYHNGEQCYKFLSIQKIRDFDDLNTLFFQVLARNVHQRTASILKDFEFVPYLNSSLFEVTELESNTIKINSLSQRSELPLFTNSVLINRKEKQQFNSLPTLNYLFAFLDAYNFASEGSEEVQEEAKTLINASVLGLIFEKINGHKDGSVFTPGFITMYMCREAVANSVLTKFNNFYNWNCTSVADLYNKIDDISQANQLINSITICDPAVGSGHFLVSALNELIRLKYELGILVDSEGKRIKKSDYTLSIENDELIVTDAENNLFEYNPLNEESRRIQETLFKEKKIIIENCLFGVDINPNSVKICRLRLWIELLKNAYYTAESDYKQLETLPNIDINIKCGNSLLHRFDLTDSIKSVLKETGISISQYRNAVSKYKNAQDKAEKWELDSMIAEIKSKLTTEIGAKDPKRLRLNKRRAELVNLLAPQLFEMSKKEQKDWQKRVDAVKREIAELESYFEEINSNKIYLGAFEWRIEFPEVLDDDGNFIGFDLIIGNPPYMRIQEIRANDSKFADYLSLSGKYKSTIGSFDIYVAFVELSRMILTIGGSVALLMPIKWTNAAFGKGLRSILTQNCEDKSELRLSRVVDFGAYPIFEVSTYVGIQYFQKGTSFVQYVKYMENGLYNHPNEFLLHLNTDSFSNVNVLALGSNTWVFAEDAVAKILEKLNKLPLRLSDVFEKIYQGIATSKDDVYFLYNCEVLNNTVKGFSKQVNRIVEIEQGLVKPLLKGEDVHRFKQLPRERFVIFPYKIENEKAILYSECELQSLFPKGYAYLKECEPILRGREKGRFDIDETWFQFGRQQGIVYGTIPKLLSPEISMGGNFVYDINGEFYHTTTVYGYIIKDNSEFNYCAMLNIMNSQILWWYLKHTGTVLANGYFRYKPTYLKDFPLPLINKSEMEKLSSLNQHDKTSDRFIGLLFGLDDNDIDFVSRT